MTEETLNPCYMQVVGPGAAEWSVYKEIVKYSLELFHFFEGFLYPSKMLHDREEIDYVFLFNVEKSMF
jgi:hypothetical protein